MPQELNDIEVSLFCKNDKHKPRDNKFGVTWCVRCGRLFNKAIGIPLLESEMIKIKIINNG